MTTAFTCPCDDPPEIPPLNAPNLPIIAYRDATFASLRARLLTPLPGETQLTAWQPGASGDLAVMMAEWWAYLGDILTFYNERIANEDYLGTATQDASVRGLIALLGYRPQPGIGATATLAALVQPGPTSGVPITLPAGLQVQSKPTPGQPPQTFEITSPTTISAPDAVTATAQLSLLSPSATTILLAGKVGNIFGDDQLLLRPRAGGLGSLVQVTNVAIAAPQNGPAQTTLSVKFPNNDGPTGKAAATFRLDRPTQTASIWTLGGSAQSFDNNLNIVLHLSSLVCALKIGDPVLFTNTPAKSQLLTTILAITDIIWDSTGNAPPTTLDSTTTDNSNASPPTSTTTSAAPPALFPHSQLTLNVQPGPWDDFRGPSLSLAGITLFYNFVEAASLLDQPVPQWPGPGTPPYTLAGTTNFAPGGPNSVLIADTSGAGVTATATTSGDLATLSVASLGTPPPVLNTPLSVMFNLLNVTRGQTVASEVLGSGDPSTPNQTFQLAKSPLTYLRAGASLVSTLAITVNGQPWTEVTNFFGQPATALVFTTAQYANQNTTIMFGDGVNGARLPSGNGNVIATYRYGSGANAPPAGALTVIASPFPGLRGLKNPVAAGGGADPDPPDQIKTYAPRSVLTFGRAVSSLDFAAIAAAAAPGTRVAAGWAWDSANQRGAVTIRVADAGMILANVKAAVAAAGDPNRPVNVVTAPAIAVILKFEILVTPTAVAAAVITGIVTALTDPQSGLFGAQNLGIGQSVFDSQIAAAMPAVSGFVAIVAQALHRADLGWVSGPRYAPPEGSYFNCDPTTNPNAVVITTAVAPNV